MDHLNTRPGVVILGGHFLSLGVVRNLAKYGIPVCVVDSDLCATQFSRRLARFVKCSPMDNNDTAFVDFLLQFADEAELSDWVIMSSTDEYVRITSQHREALSKRYTVPIPPWEAVKYLYDKRLTHSLAVERDIPVPDTYNPENVQAIKSLELDFPMVLKPAVNTRFTAVTKKKAYRADNLEELVTLYEKMATIIDPAEILIQELIPGRAESLYSFFGLFRNGKPLVGASARRPRQHPMDFGRASTLAETVNVPELETLATRFLEGISYSGLAEVEFMYDRKHGRFELLEVNPRIWGWHTIAIRAGVDLPYLAYAEAIGEEVDGGSCRDNVKWVRLLTDIPTVATEIWHGRMTIKEYFASMSGEKEFAVFSWRDPLPFLMEFLLLPYYAKKRGF